MCFSNNCCDPDPLPDVLLKVCIDLLFGTTTYIINVSQRSCIFPHDIKQSHDKPLIKTITLPKDNLKTNISVYNVSFISKREKKSNKTPISSY